MAVNVGQRNVPDTPANRQLEACQKAMDLAIHTIQICKNKNIFVEEYQDALTNDCQMASCGSGSSIGSQPQARSS